MKRTIFFLWFFFCVAIISGLFIRSYLDYLAYMTAWYEVESAMYKRQNQELEKKIAREGSLHYREAVAYSLGYVKLYDHFIYLK